VGEAAGGGVNVVAMFFLEDLWYGWMGWMVSASWVLGVSCLAQRVWIRYTPQPSVARKAFKISF
jgi:hypothetical protein